MSLPTATAEGKAISGKVPGVAPRDYFKVQAGVVVAPVLVLVLRLEKIWLGLAILAGYLGFVVVAISAIIVLADPSNSAETLLAVAAFFTSFLGALVAPLVLARARGFRLVWGRTG